MRIVAPPGVFRPISDSWLLAEWIRDEPGLRGGTVADLCTGSGAIAIAAALEGAATVRAVDRSRRAVLAARLNARLNGVRVAARRGDLFDALGDESFDLITSNPPYVPADRDELPARGPERAWDAGLDGRAVIDRICAEAPRRLRPGGVILLVHSSISGEEETLTRLRAAGLEAEVVIREKGPLGPLMSARAEQLERRGLLAPGEREEELLVVRGLRAWSATG